MAHGWPQTPGCAWARALRTHRRRRAHARGLRGDTARPPLPPPPNVTDAQQPTKGRGAHPEPPKQGSGALCRLFHGRAGRRRAEGVGRGGAGGGSDLRAGGGRMAGIERVGARLATGPPLAREGPGQLGGGRSLQFLGRWFTLGLASNSSWFREKKAALYMCKSVVAPAADGGLNLTNTFLRWDGLQGPRAPRLVVEVQGHPGPDLDPRVACAQERPV